ncbi:hypothetical protein MKW92_044788, partial [Papaver armeniacum]
GNRNLIVANGVAKLIFFPRLLKISGIIGKLVLPSVLSCCHLKSFGNFLYKRELVHNPKVFLTIHQAAGNEDTPSVYLRKMTKKYISINSFAQSVVTS